MATEQLTLLGFEAEPKIDNDRASQKKTCLTTKRQDWYNWGHSERVKQMAKLSVEYWSGGIDREASIEDKVRSKALARALFQRKPDLKGIPEKFHATYLTAYHAALSV